MQQKSIFAILGVMLAVVVTSLALVFTVGPKLDAAQLHFPIMEISDEDDFIVDENGVFMCFSDDVGKKIKDNFEHIGCDFYGPSEINEIHTEIHVEIPDKVTEVNGDWVYSIFRCSNMVFFNKAVTKVILPKNLKVIGEGAFYGCTGLTSITIPDSVEIIGKQAFEECYNLAEVIIPSGVTSVGWGAFISCNINTIYCEANTKPDEWNENWNYKTHYEKNGRYNVIWDCNKSVTFDTNSGNETITNQTVCVDHYISKPTDPTRNGFAFQYWYTTDENTPFDFANEPVTDNMTLTAKWEAVSSQNNENQNQENNANQNNETTNNDVSIEKKNNLLMAWIGGGIAAGLSVICGTAIVVAKKRRK